MTLQQCTARVRTMLDASPDTWPVYRTLLRDAQDAGRPGPIEDHVQLADVAVLVVTVGR
jgi:hypothetical protein